MLLSAVCFTRTQFPPQDSEIYAYLLKSIDPSVDSVAILANSDHNARAEALLAAAERLGLRRFVKPADIVSVRHL